MANAIAFGGKIINAGSGGDITLWTQPVSCAIGDTTCTIVDANITANSIIDVYTSNTSGDTIIVTNITVTNGQAVISFPELTEATSFRIHILI